MALDAATLTLTAGELKQTLTDAKIAKIFEPTRDELVLTLRTRTETYALLLSENGTLEQVIDIQTEQPRGKKMVSAPQILSLPAPVKRTVGVAANFLCDNAGYLLGIDSKGKPQRTRECFEASRSLHERLLAGVASPAARAVTAFFRSWDPETAREYPALAEHLEDILSGGKGVIASMEAAEKEKTGIRTLKIGYNKVFGYYIEVSNSFKDQVPDTYIRKQTLVNGERYITQELKDLEHDILSASDRVSALEYELFTRLRQELSGHVARIQATAAAVAEADCLCSLAAVAVKNNYCCPAVDESGVIEIHQGRHPVVEAMRPDALFVPNDTYMGRTQDRVSIITGPNMAGKSTYMRQVALIVLMAQMGSFVPARSAKIGLVDRVFTRIGASDDLASGQSTFMVEMAEVSTILKYATSRSLLILDEIGRGTSTYDGMAIARAVLEYAANPKRLGAKTLFATHYHELSTLEDKLPNVKNYNIAVKKRGEQMIFLRKIVPGATDDSYGIEVAKLAGIPAPVITRAREILAELESEGVVTAPAAQKEPEDQVSMMDLTSQQVVAALSAISVETLTPIEAMNELYKLKKMLD